MLSRSHRFHGHQAVRRVYRQGKAHRSQLMNLHEYTDAGTRTTRAAVVVSKKVHKSAVKRNRIRRRVYEIVRKNGERIDRPVNLVITVFSADVAEMPAAELETAVLGLLKSAKLLAGSAHNREERGIVRPHTKET